MKYIIWGLGGVGTSFLNKLKDNGLFDPQYFYCVDPSQNAEAKFIALGGLQNHFLCQSITKDNYIEHLEKLQEGDYLLDFCIDIKNLEVLEYCLEHNIHYLCTADSSWNPDPTWKSNHQHFLEYVNLKKKYSKKQNTCMIQFGMNPGLVSSLAKKCLQEIVDKDQGAFIKRHRAKLLKLLKEGKYSFVAKKIEVTDIQEVDNDSQEVNIPYEDDVCYSTWNVWAYYYETVASPEIAFGDKNKYFAYKKYNDSDAKDLYLALCKPGFEYPAISYSPQGIVNGHISTHEEIFSIRRFFTYGQYRPTVHFLYSPCDLATKSVEQFKYNPPTKFHLIHKNEIIGGGESVGIIIQGNKFSTRYFGNYIKSSEADEPATILQVSASAYAAFVYMQKHQNEGLLFPEETDENEILNSAVKYLKDYQSFECPKIDIKLGSDCE